MPFHASEYLFLSDEFSDITFIVENQSIPAHKLLMASCPYFKTMLFGATEESKMSAIELKNVSYKMFVEVLRCIYQGKVEIAEWSAEEVMNLIQLADEYQFPAIGCIVAESINVDTQIEDILEDVVGVAKRLNCVPLMEKCAASFRRSAKLLLENQDAFDKLPMELICYLIDTGFWRPADKRLVYSMGNWRKNASVEEKKRLLSKIDWKSLPGKYSEPLLRLFLENEEDGLQVKDWTAGLAYSNAIVDQIAGVYTSFLSNFWMKKFDLSWDIRVLNNETSTGCMVMFFREQVTTVTKIKFTYDHKANITLKIFGDQGAALVSGTKINENWEFILPSNFHFSGAAFEINNREYDYPEQRKLDHHLIRNLQFLSD